ncbi:MAG: ABC transporter substrate-binding protein [Paralcaligenes sp.]
MKKIIHMFRSGVLGLALAVAGAGFALPTNAEEVVRFAQPSDGFLYLPVYVAREKGYFKEEGIKADVSIFKGGAASLTAVLSGDSDIYIGVPAIGMKAADKGQNVRMFASIMNQYGSNIVIQGDVAKRLGLSEKSSMQDRLNALKGLTLGITGPGSAPDLLLRHMAKATGLDPDRDITLSPLGGAAGMLAAFKQKRIDGFCLSSPTSDTAVVQMDGFTLFNMAKGEYEPLKDFLYITLIAKDSWLTQNPELATKVVKAIWKGQKLIAEKPAEARESVRTFFSKTDPKLFDAAWISSVPAFPSSPYISKESIEKNFDFIENVEGQRIKVKPDTIFTNRYVEAAKKAL